MGETTKTIAGALVAVWLAGSGCLGTDVGNPEGPRDGKTKSSQVDVEVHFAGLRARPSPGMLTLGGGLVVEEAWFAFDRFAFREPGACRRAAESGVEGPVVVDLLADDGPSATLEEISAGPYCGFDAGLTSPASSSLPGRAPEALAGRSVVLRGEREDGVEFVLRDTVTPNLGLTRYDESFAIEADHRSFFLAVALEAAVDAGEIREIQGEDPIVVDGDNHTGILESFREEIRESAYLIRDANADGRLQVSEEDDVVATNLPGEGPEETEPEDEEDAGAEDAD